MAKTNSNTLPICHSCAHAWRAAQGYIRGCAKNLNDATPLQLYGKCAQASVAGVCDDYQKFETSTSKK